MQILSFSCRSMQTSKSFSRRFQIGFAMAYLKAFMRRKNIFARQSSVVFKGILKDVRPSWGKKNLVCGNVHVLRYDYMDECGIGTDCQGSLVIPQLNQNSSNKIMKHWLLSTTQKMKKTLFSSFPNNQFLIVMIS